MSSCRFRQARRLHVASAAFLLMLSVTACSSSSFLSSSSYPTTTTLRSLSASIGDQLLCFLCNRYERSSPHKTPRSLNFIPKVSNHHYRQFSQCRRSDYFFNHKMNTNIAAQLSSSRWMSRGGRLDPINDRDASTDDKDGPSLFDIQVMNGPFTTKSFASSRCWGRKPLFIKGAFDAGMSDESSTRESWPSWEEVAFLSCDEDAESRLITHLENDMKSFELQLGPFEEEYITNLLQNSHNKNKEVDCDNHYIPRESDTFQDCNTNDDDHASTTSSDTLSSTLSSSTTTRRRWTLLLNDVDRFHPPLSDWIDTNFAFIPRWRRDDGQISLASAGGGIGPHVDNYDVFLIQVNGVREWQVGRARTSIRDEYDMLVGGIDVRILRHWGYADNDDDDDYDDDATKQIPGAIETFILEPGDLLYLPPRVAHCGTALTDDCMTLSVGCRAPSASDMLSRLAERMAAEVDGAAVKRYQDEDLLDNVLANVDNEREYYNNSGEITTEAKRRAKKLVMDAISEVLDNDTAWDEFFGTLVTEPKRTRENYPIPLVGAANENEDDDWVQSLGIWGDPHLAVERVLSGHGALYHAEGIVFSYSALSNVGEDTKEPHHHHHHHRLFVNGEVWELARESPDDPSMSTLHSIANERRLTRDNLLQSGASDLHTGLTVSKDVAKILEELVAKGYLYGTDE